MTVSESLVDAKDATVEARLESKIERAVAALERRINQHTLWVVGWVTLVGGLIITVVLNQ